jgi:hypothetical protein
VVSTATICPSRHTNSLATKTYDILIRVTRVPSCTLTTNNIPTICDESPSFLISIPAPIGPFARSSATHLLACFDHQPASRASLDPQYRRRRSKKKKSQKSSSSSRTWNGVAFRPACVWFFTDFLKLHFWFQYLVRADHCLFFRLFLEADTVIPTLVSFRFRLDCHIWTGYIKWVIRSTKIWEGRKIVSRI